MYQVLYIGREVGDKNNAGVLLKRECSDTYDTLGELYPTFRQHIDGSMSHHRPTGRGPYTEFSSTMPRMGPPEIDK